MESSLWSVVLAAGAGQRLSRVTGGTPKQFWRPTGAKSLVEHTLARLAPICPVDRTVIVVNDNQRDHVRRWPDAHQSGRIVFQPDDRGTAAGVLFGLLPVLVTDPAAVVVVTPADHAVENPEAFSRGIGRAVDHVWRQGGVVLFGVEPTVAHPDYGWISLGSDQRVNAITPVVSFVEKPSRDVARQLLSEGAVWNTLVIVGRARDLFHLCRQRLPVMAPVFVAALTLPADTRETFLRDRYPQLPSRDLSRHVLMPSRNLAAYTWPASIGWSDLGTPDRLGQWLRTSGAPQLQTRKLRNETSVGVAAAATA
jgi:mannose-1-phosphate guanylyltransferase